MDSLVRAWRGFAGWRRTRPFWGGLLVLVGAAPIFLLPLAPIGLLIASGVGGISGLLLGAVMAVLALSLWLSPQTRVAAGVIAVLVALAAFPLSNLGGLFVGSVLGVVGGAMGASWAPRPDPAPAAAGQAAVESGVEGAVEPRA